MKFLNAAIIVVCIPFGLYIGSLWLEFWVKQSMAEWMSIGLGLPVSVGVALIYLRDGHKRATQKGGQSNG